MNELNFRVEEGKDIDVLEVYLSFYEEGKTRTTSTTNVVFKKSFSLPIKMEDDRFIRRVNELVRQNVYFDKGSMFEKIKRYTETNSYKEASTRKNINEELTNGAFYVSNYINTLVNGSITIDVESLKEAIYEL